MKRILILYTFLFLLLSILSCSKTEEPEESLCGENGIPVSDTNECFCDLYYEGQFCETEVREKFIGKWTGYNHSCSFGDSISDGFLVDISLANDIAQVEIISQNIFSKDTIVSNLDFLGFIRHTEYEISGNKIIRSFSFDIFYDENPEELTVFIWRNEDLDEFTETCRFFLKRE